MADQRGQSSERTIVAKIQALYVAVTRSSLSFGSTMEVVSILSKCQRGAMCVCEFCESKSKAKEREARDREHEWEAANASGRTRASLSRSTVPAFRPPVEIRRLVAPVRTPSAGRCAWHSSTYPLRSLRRSVKKKLPVCQRVRAVRPRPAEQALALACAHAPADSS